MVPDRERIDVDGRSVHEPVEQPARPDDLGIGRSHPCGKSSIGGDHDHLSMGLGDGHDRVVALTGRVHDLHPVHVRLAGPSPASSLQHERHRRGQPSRGHGRPHSFREASCRAWPIAPPTSRPRPDHVGSVDHQHPYSVAR